MDAPRDSSPAMAFEKDALQLTVEDVYDISYVIGRDLLKISKAGAQVSDLQFRIVRVLEMFEVLVNKYNLSVEELKMERDNLKRELDRVVGEKSAEQGSVSIRCLCHILSVSNLAGLDSHSIESDRRAGNVNRSSRICFSFS